MNSNPIPPVKQSLRSKIAEARSDSSTNQRNNPFDDNEPSAQPTPGGATMAPAARNGARPATAEPENSRPPKKTTKTGKGPSMGPKGRAMLLLTVVILLHALSVVFILNRFKLSLPVDGDTDTFGGSIGTGAGILTVVAFSVNLKHKWVFVVLGSLLAPMYLGFKYYQKAKEVGHSCIVARTSFARHYLNVLTGFVLGAAASVPLISLGGGYGPAASNDSGKSSAKESRGNKGSWNAFALALLPSFALGILVMVVVQGSCSAAASRVSNG